MPQCSVASSSASCKIAKVHPVKSKLHSLSQELPKAGFLNIFYASGVSSISYTPYNRCQPQICINIHPDAVPPIHAVSYHVATDKVPAQNGDTFRSIFSDNLQLIATRGKKASSTLLVDQHCGNGCSSKRAPLSISCYHEISGGHIGSCRCSEEGLCRRSTTPWCVLM